MRTTDRFGVSVLGARHAEGIRERARTGADRLAGLDVELLTGVPVCDALAVLVCTLGREHAAGDDTVAIGRVQEIRHGEDEPPLVFFVGEFGIVSMRT
jgi:flavin reductase (DIM6/NTAB) family NADH-FMN oxidoreductase RutF